MTAQRDAGTPAATWWHAYGQVREDMGGVWQLVVIGPATGDDEDARAIDHPAWGPYLASWTHQPSDTEKDAITPEEYRDEDAAKAQCTCGPGAWGTCDICGVDAWIKHHCPFPCDDVFCEGRSACIGCLTGRPCAVHNGED